MLRAELCEMISLTERLLAANEPAVLTTLFSANGSTYRPLGSMMVSGPGSGFIAGGVSGGCLEEYIARRGRELAERYAATMLSFQTDPDSDGDGLPSLGCGGSIEVLIERCTAEHVSFLRRFSEAHAADACSTAACVIDPAGLPSLTVRRVWFDHDGAGSTGSTGEQCQAPRSLSGGTGGLPTRGHTGGQATRATPNRTLSDRSSTTDSQPDLQTDPRLELLRQRSVAERRSRHGEVGGSRRALVHYVRPLTRLVLLGAGNDVRPVCTLAKSLGWHVTVADRRARLATRTRFPDAEEVIAADWWSGLQQIAFTAQTAVVVMTHSLDDDIEILPLLAEKPAAYVGVLGPAHRRGWVLRGAQDAAALTQEFADRVRGPIGLDLGERSAEGIAVSIVAEILAALNGRASAPLSPSAPRALCGLRPNAGVENA